MEKVRLTLHLCERDAQFIKAAAAVEGKTASMYVRDAAWRDIDDKGLTDLVSGVAEAARRNT